MNRKQFVQFAGLGTAAVVTGGMAGCATKTITATTNDTARRPDKAALKCG